MILEQDSIQCALYGARLLLHGICMHISIHVYISNCFQLVLSLCVYAVFLVFSLTKVLFLLSSSPLKDYRNHQSVLNFVFWLSAINENHIPSKALVFIKFQNIRPLRMMSEFFLRDKM